MLHPILMLCQVSGPTGTGKSNLIKDILENSLEICDDENAKRKVIIYCYNTAIPEKIAVSCPLMLHKGIPTIEEILDIKNKKKFTSIDLVFDDLMYSVTNSKTTGKKANQTLVELWTDVSRKQNINVIFSLQELFLTGRAASDIRTILKNSCYVIIFPFPGDILSVRRYFRKVWFKSLNHR